MSWKILHTEWSDGWGGQEIRILDETLAFNEKGYHMMIACQPGSSIEQEARRAGVTTLPLKMRSGVDVLAIKDCMTLIKENGIDLVHTHSSVDSWCCSIAGRLAGVPVVRSRHLSASISKGMTSRFLYMNLADRVITSGAAIRETMIRRNRFVPEKIVSIPAGIDEKKFSPANGGSGVVREALGFKTSTFVVGIVAILRTWKGHRYLIEAVQTLSKDIPDIGLVIVGNGPLEEKVKEMVRQSGIEEKIVMTGFRDDIPSLLGAMDCFVLPSIKNEATSQVIPQAMSMELPVVATDAGGISEVVKDGVTGLLVQPEDSQSLAGAIKWIYKNPGEAKKMALRGREHVHEHLTFTKMIEKTEKVYLNLLTR